MHTTTRPSAANMTAWRVVNKAGRREDLSMGYEHGAWGTAPLPRCLRDGEGRGSATAPVSRSIERHSMRVQLKPVEDQIIVITGATSGIGLVTAKMAAKHGARLVLVGRDEKALRDIETDIRRDGGEAIFVVADVADEDAMMAVAETALREFGGFDTWVNNAGVSIYGKVEDDAAGGPAPPVRDQLLGRGDRLPHRRHPSAAPRRRPDQSGQRPVGPGGSASGGLLRVQARGQGLHQRASAWSWRRRALRYRSR